MAIHYCADSLFCVGCEKTEKLVIRAFFEKKTLRYFKYQAILDEDTPMNFYIPAAVIEGRQPSVIKVTIEADEPPRVEKVTV